MFDKLKDAVNNVINNKDIVKSPTAHKTNAQKRYDKYLKETFYKTVEGNWYKTMPYCFSEKIWQT